MNAFMMFSLSRVPSKGKNSFPNSTTSPRPGCEAATPSLRRVAGSFECQRAQSCEAIAGGSRAHRLRSEFRVRRDSSFQHGVGHDGRLVCILDHFRQPLAHGRTSLMILIELRVGFQQVRVELRLRVRGLMTPTTSGRATLSNASHKTLIKSYARESLLADHVHQRFDAAKGMSSRDVPERFINGSFDGGPKKRLSSWVR
jgi:hypothetical protein